MKRYEEVLQFISLYQQANDNKTPTIRQIAAALGIASTNTVAYHLRQLEEKRMIRRNAYSRDITLLVDYQQILRERYGVGAARCPTCGALTGETAA